MSATPMPQDARRPLNATCPDWCTIGPHNDPRDHLGELLYVPATAEPDRFAPDTTNGPISVPTLRLSLSATSMSETAVDLEVFEPQHTGVSSVSLTLRETTQLRDRLTHLLEVAEAADAGHVVDVAGDAQIASP